MQTSGPRPRLGFVESWDEHADRPALITDRGTITYRKLAAFVATEMELFGSTRRLVLIEPQNTVSAIVSYLAALQAGDWHLLSVADLEARARGRPRGPLRWMETSIVLRAVAIVMVCANHVGLSHVWGGAHVLLAVAGYSFARFQVNAIASSGRARPLFQSIARIAVPSVVVIAIAYVATREYDVWNVLLIEHLFGPDSWDLGPDGWDPRLNYWFIEVLVVSLVLCAALLSIPAVRGLERAQPFGFAIAFLGVCLVLRFHIFAGEVPMEPYRPQTTVWLFAIGWAAARDAT
jgi:hypothetical protein